MNLENCSISNGWPKSIRFVTVRAMNWKRAGQRDPDRYWRIASFILVTATRPTAPRTLSTKSFAERWSEASATRAATRGDKRGTIVTEVHIVGTPMSSDKFVHFFLNDTFSELF